MNLRFFNRFYNYVFSAIVFCASFLQPNFAAAINCKTSEQIRERVQKSMVAIINQDNQLVGTGFLINKYGDIATAKHLLIEDEKTKDRIKVQYSQGEILGLEKFNLLQHKIGQQYRDWVILKRIYEKQPNFDKGKTHEYTYLEISHDRHPDDIPNDGFWWRVNDFTKTSLEISQGTQVWIGPNIALGQGIFQATLKGFGGDSGAIYIDKCKGAVHGLLWQVENRGLGDFDHTGALMELAHDRVVDFDTPRGIFRGEADRRDFRRSLAFWNALEKQLNMTDRELNLLNWSARVTNWAILKKDADMDTFALEMEVGYKRLARSSPISQRHPHKKFLANFWLCPVWDIEVAKNHCINIKEKNANNQRLTQANAFVNEPEDDSIEAKTGLSISKRFYIRNRRILEDMYQDKDFSSEEIKGIVARFQPEFDTINVLNRYDLRTGYPIKESSSVFSVVYEVCIPKNSSSWTKAKTIATSQDKDFKDIADLDQGVKRKSCIFEFK